MGVQSQQFIYLTSDKDLGTWKLLNESLTKRNVFVGNLSFKVDQSVLKSVFETLVVNEQRHLMKVRAVKWI
jgi:RNA recognition motif-containing protein